MWKAAGGYVAAAAVGGAAVYCYLKKVEASSRDAKTVLNIDTQLTKESHPVATISPKKSGPPEPLLSAGSPLPQLELDEIVDGKITKVALASIFGSKKGILVSVPGAFTPG